MRVRNPNMSDVFLERKKPFYTFRLPGSLFYNRQNFGYANKISRNAEHYFRNSDPRRDKFSVILCMYFKIQVKRKSKTFECNVFFS